MDDSYSIAALRDARISQIISILALQKMRNDMMCREQIAEEFLISGAMPGDVKWIVEQHWTKDQKTQLSHLEYEWRMH
jgi:hypothetical protein